MEKTVFEAFIKDNAQKIQEIRTAAWELHQAVNQTYDKTLPYGFHLSMVADAAMKYGYEVVKDEVDILPLIFGAYFHDSIEDARLTYNNVLSLASKYMTQEQALTAAEIVYALTNEKGRTREERADERYYAGIRNTPFAPFVKLCDRFANMTYSAGSDGKANAHMIAVYSAELEHFINAITANSVDPRFALSPELVSQLKNLSI